MFTVPTEPMIPDLSSLSIDSNALERQLGVESSHPIGAREKFISRMVLARAATLCEPRGVFRVFGVQHVDTGYALSDADLCLSSPQLLSLGGDSLEYIALLAVTVGPALEEAAATLGEHGDVLGQVMMDAAGSVAVEQAADMMSAAIALFASEHGLHASVRYSPGYGDLSLSFQKSFERLLSMRETLGITLLGGEVLQPYKSITAFVGLRKAEFSVPADRACDVCQLKNTCDRRVCRHGHE